MLKLFAQKILRVCGWRVTGELPEDIPKCVLIAAPHTSNWDLLWMLLAGLVLDIRPSWFGKHVLFRPPLGFFLRALGGIPIDRRTSNKAVDERIAIIKQSKRICVVVPPEGTRERVDYWKTGFYHIAHGAGIPIVCGFLDYETKTMGIGPIVDTTGDIHADMVIFREFYQSIKGREVDKFGPIQVRPVSDRSNVSNTEK